MLARQVVLLTPLECAVTVSIPISIQIERATPLECALTKNTGVGEAEHQSPFMSHACLLSLASIPGSCLFLPVVFYLSRLHGHQRKPRQSPRATPTRLPGANSPQYRSQSHRPELSLACALQRVPRHGHVAAHADPLGLARCASSASLQPRQLAGSFCRSHHAPRFPDGFSGAHRRAPGRLRKLFSSAANWRTRNSFPHPQPPRVLAHGLLAARPDENLLPFASASHHPLDRQRRHLLRRVPAHHAQFQRHCHRSSRSRHDSPALAIDRLGLVHQRDSRGVNLQHSSRRLRLPALRSPLGHPLFSFAEFHFRSTTRRHRQRRSHSLAAPLLVFRPSRSLRGHASVLRPHHAYHFHVFPHAGLEKAPSRYRALRCRPLRFLRLGTAHVFQRYESFFAARLFAAGFFARTARYDPPDQLARHPLERAGRAQHLHAFRARVHFAFSLRWTLRDFPRAPRSCRCCRQRRFRHWTFPSRHGCCRHVRHSQRPVFLVPQTFWPPPERISRQDSFLAHLCRRLLRLHAHALARLDRAFARFAWQSIGVHSCRRLCNSQFHHRRDSHHCFRAGALPPQFSVEPLPRRKNCALQPLARHHARMDRYLTLARRRFWRHWPGGV